MDEEERQAIRAYLRTTRSEAGNALNDVLGYITQTRTHVEKLLEETSYKLRVAFGTRNEYILAARDKALREELERLSTLYLRTHKLF